MRNWLRQHRFAIADAFFQMRRTPSNYFLNVLVISMSLALPFAGITLLENLQNLTGKMAVEPEISLFIHPNASREDALALGETITRILSTEPRQSQVVFIPKEAALKTLEQKDGISEIVRTLGRNPLPDSYLIRIAGTDGDPRFATYVDNIAAQFKNLALVHKVQIDSDWIKRLAAIIRFVRASILLLGITLAIIIVAVIFNTIRLQVLTRTDEITLVRLVGASRSYIRRPFYYTGILLGFLSGALALIIVALSLYPLNSSISELARLYSTEITLARPGMRLCIILLSISTFLGWIGALLSVNRHLRRIH